jgi:putative DNA primase/helicase
MFGVCVGVLESYASAAIGIICCSGATTALWAFLRAHRPEVGTTRKRNHDITKQASDYSRVDQVRLIRMALDQVPANGRNNAGFWLAQQLRDNQFSHGEAEAAMRHYCSRVPAVNTKGEPESYGEDEMLASLRSAYSGVRRKPWGPSKPHPLGWRENFQRPPTVTTSDGTSEPLPRDQGTPGLLHYLQNDHGNSERIVALHGQDLRYCPPFKKWLVWDGRRWVVDIADEARRLAKKTILEYLRQAISKGQEAAEKFARQSLDTKRITNALREAQDQAYVLPDHLDQNPYLLNFLNCTIDLRTGARREHRREDLITKIVHFNYRPDAECPRFMQFLEEVTGGGPDESEAQLERSGRLISYLQIALGYSLTGNTSEKAVFLLYGPRDNGKSTLLATSLKLLEEYSVLLQIDTLMIKPGGETNNSQADLADLRGARFVMTSETEEGQRLSEGKLKRCVANSVETFGSLGGSWRRGNQRCSKGGISKPRSSFCAFAGIFGLRSASATLKNLWLNGTSKSTTSRSGDGLSAMVRS